MTQMQDLKVLSKSSARIATFAVRLCDGAVDKYTYTQKRTQTSTIAYKFEVTLVGSNPQEYCIGYVKGSETDCKKAAASFKDGTIWALSKVALDTFTQAQYVSTPIRFRVDLAKSTTKIQDESDGAHKSLYASMPSSPVPPTSVADVTRIATNRSTDLIAVVKEVQNEKRTSKAGEMIVDIVLVDNSMGSSGKLAAIDVSVFGESKIEKLTTNVGKPMAFFNLSIACDKKGGKPKITHFGKDKIAPAPECPKTVELRHKADELQAATDTEKLTQVWEPNQSRDVAGPVTLSCAAFLDFTKEIPEAAVPDVSQLMWVHIEEPAPEETILIGDRIWFQTQLRDNSGKMSVGVPLRSALELANVKDKDTFIERHAAGELNLPLLCHARVSRTIRKEEPTGKTFVNHILEKVEPVSWDPSSAPNATYTDVLAILNNCPPHDEGIAFSCLEDLQPDPFCGMRISYGGSPGPKCVYVAVLVASNRKSKTDPIGENGFQVVTAGVKDVANPAGTATAYVGDHTLLGYCNVDDLPGFRLDPPRGRDYRVAFVLISKVDAEGFHIHKVQNIEPDQMDNTIKCMQRLRRMSKQIRPEGTGKRSHDLSLNASDLKKPPALNAIAVRRRYSEEGVRRKCLPGVSRR